MSDLLNKPLDSAVLIRTIVKWLQASDGARRRSGEEDAARAAELAAERTDPEIARIALAWLRDLPNGLDSATRNLEAGDFESARELAHTIIGSGGTLQLPEFSTLGEALQAAARAEDMDECWRLISAMREQIGHAAERTQRLVNLPHGAASGLHTGVPSPAGR